MKIFCSILIAVILLAATGKAQDDTAKFRFAEKKNFAAGTVLHYVKTNIDGSRPEYVSQYIAAPGAMECCHRVRAGPSSR